jgi:hypothetical protein
LSWGREAIEKEFLLVLEIAILKDSFFIPLFSPQPHFGLNLIHRISLGLEMPSLIFTKSVLTR